MIFLRLGLGLHQDVPGVHLLVGEAGLALHRVIGRLQPGVRRALGDRHLEDLLAQHLDPRPGQRLLDLRLLLDLLLERLLLEQMRLITRASSGS